MAMLGGSRRGSCPLLRPYLRNRQGVRKKEDDGTFSATITRSTGGTNNLAKSVTWSGTVVRSGNRIVLRSSQEQWISLSRSGDTLYGVLEDPVVEAVVTLTLKRAVD